MNAVPTNPILAEKEAARTIVASQEKEREKTYQERKTLCAELHKKKIKFYPSASLKELQKLLQSQNFLSIQGCGIVKFHSFHHL